MQIFSWKFFLMQIFSWKFFLMQILNFLGEFLLSIRQPLLFQWLH